MAKVGKVSSKKSPRENLTAREILCSILAGTFLTALALAFFPDIQKAEFNPDFNAFMNMSDGMSSDGELSDYTPMFLPTRWNFRNAYNALSAKDFTDLPLNIPDKNDIAPLPEFTPAPPSNRIPESIKYAAMQIGARGFFQGFGSKDTPDFKLGKAEGIVKVTVIDTSTGKTADKFTVKVPAINSGELWSPVSFTITNFSLGGKGRPSALQKSGVEAVDKALEAEAESCQRIKDLPEGRYKIIFNR